MPSFEDLLKEKNKRLDDIPAKLQTAVQKQQRKIINDVLSQLDKLDTVKGGIKINASNLRIISNISDELKTIFINEEYLKAVREFSKEFDTQAGINSDLIEKGFGKTADPLAAKEYINIAKKNAVEALIGSPADANFIKPIQGILESAVVNGSSINDTIDSIRLFVEGGEGEVSKILKYTKQIANDSFAIADRSYTSIVSDSIGNDWFYFSGSEVNGTRCFCKERVGKYFHYLEVESWGKGDNLADCNIGDGTWSGEIPGTNESTIYSFLGGYNCLHSLMPVSESVVPDEDLDRARNLGYLE